MITIPTSKSQKIDDTKFRTKDAMKKTRTGRIIKLFAKSKDVKEVLFNPQKIFPLD